MRPPCHEKEGPLEVKQSTIDHFSSISLAKPTLDDSDFRIYSSSRRVTDNGKGHTLTGKTWNTETTIRELLSLARPSKSDAPLPQPESERAEVRRFYTFGSDLNAHPNLLHGGVIASVLDSTLGNAIGVQFPQGALRMFTVQLNVTYKKAVPTPGTVMARSWVTKVEADGRKIWAAGELEGEGGVVYATAEGMWLKAKSKPKL
jgi:acyl-coenzyme A thioesterase PaaI-like protein